MSEADQRKAGHAAKTADLAFIFNATTNKWHVRSPWGLFGPVPQVYFGKQSENEVEARGEQLMFYRLDTGERLLTDEEARQVAEEAGAPRKRRSPDFANNRVAGAIPSR